MSCIVLTYIHMLFLTDCVLCLDFLPKNIQEPVDSDVFDDSLEVASHSSAEKLKSAAHSFLKTANDPSKVS